MAILRRALLAIGWCVALFFGVVLMVVGMNDGDERVYFGSVILLFGFVFHLVINWIFTGNIRGHTVGKRDLNEVGKTK